MLGTSQTHLIEDVKKSSLSERSDLIERIKKLSAFISPL